jgi:poly(3-hydroxybutyrate) depolymerase
MSDGDAPEGIDDIDFTSKLLTRLATNLCVDTDRIYATGLGTGGGMVHLAACSPELSTRIAAYALVNGNIFSGFETKGGRTEVKELSSFIWQRCKPGRFPTRILTVHSENNTLFDYWGEIKFKEKKRMPVVAWLVEWAQKSNCGMALEMPKPWDAHNSIYKTLLEMGYIFEGFIQNGLVTKASYHCWGREDINDTDESVDGEDKNKSDSTIEEGTKTNEKSEEVKDESTNSAKIEDKPKGSTWEPADIEETIESETKLDEAKEQQDSIDPEEKKKIELEQFITQLRDSIILEHYYVRGAGHGWPRGYVLKPKDEDGKYVDSTIKDPEWKEIDVPDPEPEIDFSKDVFTFLYGYNSTSPVPGILEFDSTVRVLDWFRMFRLSDAPPTPTLNADGLTEFETDTLSKLMEDIQKAMDTGGSDLGADSLTQEDEAGDIPTDTEESVDGVKDVPLKHDEGASKQSASRERDEL